MCFGVHGGPAQEVSFVKKEGNVCDIWESRKGRSFVPVLSLSLSLSLSIHLLSPPSLFTYYLCQFHAIFDDNGNDNNRNPCRPLPLCSSP